MGIDSTVIQCCFGTGIPSRTIGIVDRSTAVVAKLLSLVDTLHGGHVQRASGFVDSLDMLACFL